MRRPICLMSVAFSAGIYSKFHMEFWQLAVIVSIFVLLVFVISVNVDKKHQCNKILEDIKCEGYDDRSVLNENIDEIYQITKLLDLKKMQNLLCLALAFFLFGVTCLTFHMSKVDPMVSFADSSVTIVGTVLEVQKRDDERYRLIISVQNSNIGNKSESSRDGKKRVNNNSKVLVNVFGDIQTLALGDQTILAFGDRTTLNYADIAGRTVEVYGKIELPAQRRNPKTFDYRLYLQSRGINTVMNVAPHDVTVLGLEKRFFINSLSKVRHNFINNVTNAMQPHNAGILIGMLFGDKNTLDDDVYEMFQKNGTAHILAVSGLHIGALYIFLSRLLRARRNFAVNSLILFFLFTYVALAAFAPSAIRAGGMIAIHIVAKFLHRRYDMLCAGACMAFVMMLFNPLIIFDLGFQLSFLAIFIIAIVIPAFARMKSGDVVSIVVLQASLAPIIAYLFNYFSIAAFFLNAPVIFIAGLIIPIGIILIPLSYILPSVFHIGVGLVNGLCEIMYKLNELTYEKGNFFVNVISPTLWVLFMFYGLLLVGSSEAIWIFFKRKETRRILLSVGLVVVLAFTFAMPASENFHKAQIIFVDVGQGDCIHIKTPSGKNILVDGGGSRNFDVGKRILMPYLLKNGVNKIDIAFISHMHTDHYAGLFSLANNFNIKTLALYEANKVIEQEILHETGLLKEQLLYLTAGQVIVVDEEVRIEVLFPERRNESDYVRLKEIGDNENDISLILKVHYRGVSTLLTGDLSFRGEDGFFEVLGDNREKLKSDFLKVAHHGSKNNTSDKFIALANPDIAVFQVGKNGFGHPTAEVLSKVERTNAQIYRNDNHGAIGIFINRKGNVEVKTML